jgi:mono/diheme cytochrome c family protein
MTIRMVWFCLGALFLASITTLNAEEIHQIPDAPADYLAKKNPYLLAEVSQDKKFIKKIGRMFKRKCQKCHGKKGDGKGSRAADFTIKPIAFAQPGYLQGRLDGQLYWIIENGSPGTEMPAHGFGSRANYTVDEIWRVITFLRYQFTN